MSTNYISQITASNGTTYDIQEGVTTRIFRATCLTANTTAAKVATLDDSTGYSLAAGVRVAVTFTYGNTATSPTLNVNSGGAKNIYYRTDISSAQKVDELCVWGANETIIFTYNGSSWIMMGSSLALYNVYNKAASSGSGTITEVKTTAGTHSTIDVTSGAANFNVPTKTSHLTNDSGFVTTDEKLKVEQLSNNTTYSVILSGGSRIAASKNVDSDFEYVYMKNDTGTGSAKLTLGNSTASGTAGNKQGQLILYGSTAYAHTISGAPTAARTLTLPDKTGTLALTSDIPAITLNGSATTSPSFYAPTSVGPSGYVLKSNGSGAPTWVSATLTDTQVTSTAVTAATTNYLVGSTTSTTTTGGLSKHASGVLYTTADSGTSGYTQLRLGNTTATTSAGGKEGQIRLYGTNATYYLELKPGAIASSNKTITFPNKTGTVALIPTEGTGGPGTKAVVYNTVDGFVSIDGAYFYQSTSDNKCYLSLGGNGGEGNGSIKLHTSNTNRAVELAPINSLSADRTITLPDKDGTVALTSDIPTVPTITLNGSATASPTFYAPTSAGTSGYYLKSNGSGAPTWDSLLDKIYPVGSIYISTVSTSPVTLFGGTWEQIEDRFLLAAGSTYAAGGTGGEATHTLTAAESGVPAHGHGFTQPKVAIGTHQHTPYTGSTTAEYFVTAEETGANNTKVAYSSSGNRWVNGLTSESHFHHRVATTAADLGTKTATGGAVQNNTAANATSAHNNMPPYLAVYVWKRTA